MANHQPAVHWGSEKEELKVLEDFMNSDSTGGIVIACNYCYAIRLEMYICGGCKEYYYCNRECQKKDWPKHRNACIKHTKFVKSKTPK